MGGKGALVGWGWGEGVEVIIGWVLLHGRELHARTWMRDEHENMKVMI